MNTLYPLRFSPIYMDKIWGGQKIKTILGKDFGDLPNCGESWEISGVEGHVSIVSNGSLADNTLEDLIEVYMGDLLGDHVYDKFGLEFPLLIKFIDANEDLSVQVHPNDNLAKIRHNAFGKTEMWYVLQADKGAKISCGFNRPLDRAQYLRKLSDGQIMDILNFTEVSDGDVFFMPAGRVHAIGKGAMVAEIQQTSDITYRIYDYNRKDALGNQRELHTDLAIDAIDFSYVEEYRSRYELIHNKSVSIADCDYFKTNILELDTTIEKDIYGLDSFMILICVEGEFEIQCPVMYQPLKKGETILVPASVHRFRLSPVNGNAKILEVHL